MREVIQKQIKSQSGSSGKLTGTETDYSLYHQAFNNTLQANIITTVSNGKIIMVNGAACKLLGYSKKALLIKNRSTIFDVNHRTFKTMLKQRTTEGHSIRSVTLIKKDGSAVPCEITSAVFVDAGGIEQAITTIADIRKNILKQKNIDRNKEKVVAENIVQAKSKQRKIDSIKDKIVSANIDLIRVRQIKLDARKEKTVSDNIKLAKSHQKKIDFKKAKIVSANIDLARVRQIKLDARKEKTVSDNIKLAKSNQKKIDFKKAKIVSDNIDLVRVRQIKLDARKEKTVSDNIKLAKLKQKKIDVKNKKIVLSNIILAQAKSDASQVENTEWKKNIGKTLYDVIWDWNIVSGQIYVSDSIHEVFGYRLKNNTISFNDFRHFLLPEEKVAVEKKLQEALGADNKSWKDSYMIRRRDGSFASTTSRASIIRGKDGIAIHLIGTVKDTSKMEELKRKLEEQISIKNENNEVFNLAAQLSYDGLWDWDISTNEFFLGAGFEELFGFGFRGTENIAFEWSNFLHPDDKLEVEQGIQAALASTDSNWEHTYRFIRTDGTVANVFGRASIIRNAQGKAYRMIGVIHDLSRQKELEEKLEQEITLKEKQIAQATEDAKETERCDIGKELHDNVNQLLGASRLYIEMAKRGGEQSGMHLTRSEEYTLAAIEEIRKLTKGLTTDTIKNFGLGEAINSVSRDTMEINPVKISFVMKEFEEKSVDDKFKLNLFRIVQEQLNNIIKHAKATKIAFRLYQNKKFVILTISDNGIGFDTTKKHKGIGMSNINSRASSYKGTADFSSETGKGCRLTIKLPINRDMVSNL